MLLHPADVSERAFIKRLRQAIRGRSVLMHGTRFGRKILRDDKLLRAPTGDDAISFTRCVEMAVYWAHIPRDFDEGSGAVLIFDRQKLNTQYRLDPFHDPIWDRPGSIRDEAEERVWCREVTGLSSLLDNVIWCPQLSESRV